MLLYRPIRCTQDQVDLQSDTDKIGQWTQDNFLTIIISLGPIIDISVMRLSAS